MPRDISSYFSLNGSNHAFVNGKCKSLLSHRSLIKSCKQAHQSTPLTLTINETSNNSSNISKTYWPKSSQAWSTRSAGHRRSRGSSMSFCQKSEPRGNDFSPTSVPIKDSASSCGLEPPFRGVEGTTPIAARNWGTGLRETTAESTRICCWPAKLRQWWHYPGNVRRRSRWNWIRQPPAAVREGWGVFPRVS